jgi:pimeloyl-ACP methyl ester carboxylesterase
MKKLYLFIVLFLSLYLNGMSQDYALFIHGFQGSDESWLGSGTPDDWVIAGVIDNYVVINYDLEDLESASSQAALIASIAGEMNNLSPTGNWVIVGHSLGGIIARAGYPSLQAALPQANIKAILNVGSPHQGARAAHVSIGHNTGYINVEPVLNEFKSRVEEPLDEVHPVIGYITGLIAPDALAQIDKAPVLLEEATGVLEYYADASVTNTVKNIIGMNGSMIQLINSGQLPEPAFKRSVIGAEKQFIVPRAASELLGPGNEASTIKNFNDIRSFYGVNADAWNYTQNVQTLYAMACAIPFSGCSTTTHLNYAKDARRARDRWNTGRNALGNIDGTWGKMIDSYAVVTMQIGLWVPVECEDTSGGSGGDDMPGYEDGQGGNSYEFECWDYQYVNTSMITATKNDVIVGPPYAVWNPNEAPNDRILNWWYADITTDGGYNHFELRRHKRAYTLPGVFQQGDLAPPMEETADWLEITVFGNL